MWFQLHLVNGIKVAGNGFSLDWVHDWDDWLGGLFKSEVFVGDVVCSFKAEVVRLV
jgi:hypothetical protein